MTETRVALTVSDLEGAVALYEGALGLPVIESWDNPTGRGRILDGGRATLELLDEAQTAHVDRVEAGADRRTSGLVRLALEVQDSVATADRLVGAGAELLADPVVTPSSHRNVRLRDADGRQLTLFTVLDSG